MKYKNSSHFNRNERSFSTLESVEIRAVFYSSGRYGFKYLDGSKEKVSDGCPYVSENMGERVTTENVGTVAGCFKES